MGEILGSIGEDGMFNLWQEDVVETPNSGRRFRKISSLRSETNVPFTSLDFKNIMTETCVALITRDGYLAVYEPIDSDNLTEWRPITRQYVCSTPSRQEETGFKVCFHHEKLPCWTAIQAGLDRNALSLAVAAMDVVKILRTDKGRRLYEAAQLTGARNIIRDVAWANGAMRGFDVVATASKDGAIRIYELSTPTAVQGAAATSGVLIPPTIVETPSSPRGGSGARNAPSGIGAGLAGASRSKESAQGEDQNPGAIKHAVKLVAELTQHHGAVWRVSFSQMGE